MSRPPMPTPTPRPRRWRRATGPVAGRVALLVLSCDRLRVGAGRSPRGAGRRPGWPATSGKPASTCPVVVTYDITDRSHTDGGPRLSRRCRPPAGTTRRSGSTAASTTCRCARRTPCTTSSTARSGSPTIRSLSESDVGLLADALPDNGIMSPREDLPTRGGHGLGRAARRWTARERRAAGALPEEYGDGHTAPEFGVTCHGGTPDPSGAVPAAGRRRLIACPGSLR